MMRRGVRRPTVFLECARLLETKLPQVIQAQLEVGDLMLLVGSKRSDCLFNAILRDGRPREEPGAHPRSQCGTRHCQWAGT